MKDTSLEIIIGCFAVIALLIMMYFGNPKVGIDLDHNVVCSKVWWEAQYHCYESTTGITASIEHLNHVEN